MRKLIMFVILFTSLTLCQDIGGTATPYDTTDWDEPAEFTEHYQLPVYRLLSNPGGWINLSQAAVDSLLWELIVYTDSLMHIIRNDTLIHSPYMSGKGEFSADDTSITIPVVGLDTNDVVVITPLSHAVTDQLTVIIGDDEFDVRRGGSGTNHLRFTWIWIRKYQ